VTRDTLSVKEALASGITSFTCACASLTVELKLSSSTSSLDFSFHITVNG